MRDALDFFFADRASPLFNDGAGRRPREVQQRYASEVLTGLNEGIGMIEGSTGVGKTVGYLAAAMLKSSETGARIVVSTQTIELQEQVSRTMAWLGPMVENMTGTRFPFEKRIGRRNFLDLERLQKFIARYAREISNENLAALRAVETWMVETEGPHLRQGMENMLDELEMAFPFDPAIIGLQSGTRSADYDAMIERAAGAKVLIVNHALLCLNLLLSDRLLHLRGRDGEPPAILIADEADHLEGTMTGLMSERVNFRMMAGMLPDGAPEEAEVEFLADRLSLAACNLRALHESADVGISRFSNSIAIRIEESLLSLGDEARVLLEDILADLSALQNVLKPYRDSHHEGAVELLESLKGLRASLAGALGDEEEARRDTFFYWTPVRGEPGMSLEPENARRILARLWLGDSAPRVIFTSATMTRHDGARAMTDFGNEVGISGISRELSHCARVSPERFGEMTFVQIDPLTTPAPMLTEIVDSREFPELNEWHARANLKMIARAAAVGGRILVLVPAYRDSALYQRLMEKSPALSELLQRSIFSTQRQRRASRRAFEERENAILFAPDAWVGLDMPGLIRHIVMPRVPLLMNSTAANHSFEEYLRARGERNTESYIRGTRFAQMQNKAIRKLTQGFGRGIRVASDEVTVWIGDPRWPAPEGVAAPHAKSWSRTIASSVPERFRPALREAEIFYPEGKPEAVRDPVKSFRKRRGRRQTSPE
ncbi:hypothetical protein KUV57_12410 [Epibacterium sp. DP7N7-1]|nr:hypothetical protein [Epibacterium sp. DP7N7-1]